MTLAGGVLVAVSDPYPTRSSSREPVEAPPHCGTYAVNNGQALTVPLLNVSQFLWVWSDVQVTLRFRSTAGAAFRVTIPAGIPFAAPLQCKGFTVANGSGGNGTVSWLATLTPVPADRFPSLSEANGFDGIDSHNAGVAVA